MDDPLGTLAAADQAVEAMKPIARMTRAYYAELLSSGFSKEEALRLTLEFQRNLLPGRGA